MSAATSDAESLCRPLLPAAGLEPVALRPLLIMQGELDDNVLPAVQKKFAETYRAAGGDCRYELFENSEHEWTGKPGPQTTRAYEMVRGFIARNLSS